MRQPAWYLLLWAALVASLVAGMLGFSVRSRLGVRSPRRAILIGFFLGVLFWGPVYGIAFELLGSANAIFGALLGTLHGAIAAAVAWWRRTDPAPRGRDSFASVHWRRIVTRVVYGAIIGFLYVVPSP